MRAYPGGEPYCKKKSLSYLEASIAEDRIKSKALSDRQSYGSFAGLLRNQFRHRHSVLAFHRKASLCGRVSHQEYSVALRALVSNRMPCTKRHRLKKRRNKPGCHRGYTAALRAKLIPNGQSSKDCALSEIKQNMIRTRFYGKIRREKKDYGLAVWCSGHLRDFV
jgi:hypothetical protein